MTEPASPGQGTEEDAWRPGPDWDPEAWLAQIRELGESEPG